MPRYDTYIFSVYTSKNIYYNYSALTNLSVISMKGLVKFYVCMYLSIYSSCQ
nr:MAG TPA: hypothetical protein [Caudoviricetes sp.]